MSLPAKRSIDDTSMMRDTKILRTQSKLPTLVQRLAEPCPDSKDPLLLNSRSLFYNSGSYQLKLALLLVHRAHVNGRQMFFGWPTIPGVPASQDDLLLSYRNPNTKNKMYRWVQFKRRTLEDAAEMTAADFLEPNGRLSLLNYYALIGHLKSRQAFPNWQSLDRCLILVQHKVSVDALKAAGLVLHKVTVRDPLFDLATTRKGATLQTYRIHKLPAKFLQRLGQGLEVNRLASELASHVLSGKFLTWNSAIIWKYHYALVAEEVVLIDGSNMATLHPSFVQGRFSSPRTAIFGLAFLNAIQQQLQGPFEEQWPAVVHRAFPVSAGIGAWRASALATLPTDLDADAEVEQFRTKLFLAFDLPGDRELSQMVRRELGGAFNLIDGSFVFDRLWAWLQAETDYLADHCRCRAGGKNLVDGVLRHLGRWNLGGVVVNDVYQSRALQRHSGFAKNHLTSLAAALDGARLVRVNTACQTLTFLKMCQLLRWRTENDYAVLDFDRLQDLCHYATAAMKSFRSYWLVVEMLTVSSGDAKRMAPVFRRLVHEVQRDAEGDKKLVLITEEQSRVSDEILCGEPHFVHCDVHVGFEPLPESMVAFQKELVRLGDLLADSDRAEFGLEMENRILQEEGFRLGRSLKLAHLRQALPYYVPRRMRLHQRFDHESLRAASSDGALLLLLTGVTEKEVLKVLSKKQVCRFGGQCLDVSSPDVKVILFEDASSMAPMVERLRTKLPKRTVRWWHVHGQFYVVMKPSSDDGVRRSSSRPVVKVITGAAGMGKSVALCNLALNEKRRWPAHWVLQVNLADFQEQLTTARSDDLAAGLEFLYAAGGLKEALERKWLEHCVVDTGHVLLLFDGFDEIDPQARGSAVRLIGRLKTTRVDTIWIAVRPCHWPELEAEVADLRYDLLPLSRLDQEAFVAGYWSSRPKAMYSTIDHQRMTTYAQQFLKQLERLGRRQVLERLTNPWHAQMMAEIYWQDLPVALPSGDGGASFQLQMVPPSSNEDLCEVYAERKILKGMRLTFDPKTHERNRARFATVYGHLAILQLFGNEAQKCGLPVDPVEDEDQEVLLAMRMLHRRRDGQLLFVNRSMAEYFALRRLDEMVRRLDRTRPNPVIAFLKKMYFAEDFDSFRIVLDRALTKGHDLLEAILSAKMDKVSKFAKDHPELATKSDALGRSPLHLAAMYLPAAIPHLLLAERNLDLAPMDRLGFTPLCYALALLDKLPENGEAWKLDWTVLYLARKLSDFGVVQFVPIIQQRRSNRECLIEALDRLVGRQRLTTTVDMLDCAGIVRNCEHRFDDLRGLLDIASERKRCEILATDGCQILKKVVHSRSSAIFAWIADNLKGQAQHTIEDAILQETSLVDQFTGFIENRNFAEIVAVTCRLTPRLCAELWHRLPYRETFLTALSVQEVQLVACLLRLFDTEALFAEAKCAEFFGTLLRSEYRNGYFIWMLDRLATTEQRAEVLASIGHLKLFRDALLNCDCGLLACLANLRDHERSEMTAVVGCDECRRVFRQCLERRYGPVLQLLLRFVADAERQCVVTFLDVKIDGLLSFKLGPDTDELCVAQICDDLDDYRLHEYQWSIWGHLVYALLRRQMRTQA